MNNQLSKKYLYGSLFLLLMSIIILVAMLPAWWQNRRMRRRIVYLRQHIQKLEKTRARYHAKLQALHKNPVYVEFLLRHKLHYGRKGEKRWLD